MSQRSTDDALTVLYKEHHSWLKTWIKRRIDCHAQAEDFTQDTFVRIANQPSKLESLRQPKAYLSSVARNIVTDWYRRKSVEMSYLDSLAMLPEAVEISAEERVILIDVLSRIDDMLDGLSERRRNVFLMSQLEGMKFVDIAKCMNLSISTVRKHYLKAFAHCLTILDDD